LENNTKQLARLGLKMKKKLYKKVYNKNNTTWFPPYLPGYLPSSSVLIFALGAPYLPEGKYWATSVKYFPPWANNQVTI